jgi:hypothetical protein
MIIAAESLEINVVDMTKRITLGEMQTKAHKLKGKIEGSVKEHFAAYANGVVISYGKDFSLHITITINSQILLDKTYNLVKIENFDQIFETIVQEMKEFIRVSDELLKKHNEIMNAITITTREMIYKEWVCGKAKYANLGYMRYAYVGLNAPGTYTQWIRVFFNREGIVWEKTKAEIKTDREERMNKDPVGNPPDVQYVFENLEDQALLFLKGYEKELFTHLTALPLNKSELKESTVINMLLLSKQSDNMLIVAGKTEICDPNADLYLFTIIDNNWFQRSVKGYCKKIEGSDEIFEIITSEDHYSTDYIDSLDGCKVHAYKSYKFGEKMTNFDEYVKYVIDEAVKEWRAKVAKGDQT